MSLLLIYPDAADEPTAAPASAPGSASTAAPDSRPTAPLTADPTAGSTAAASRGAPPSPRLRTDDPERIAAELARRGIGFQRWPARRNLAEGADQAAILAAYAEEVARVQAMGRYPTVDAIRLMPEHPEREVLRRKFLAEHTHAEDEVRFFVEGQGLFCLHLPGEVLQVLCTSDDWIAVPAGTRHWFDMGPAPHFCALRFFDNPEGWVARFTGDPIADRFPLLDALEPIPLSL